jgi:hypothetical protein
MPMLIWHIKSQWHARGVNGDRLRGAMRGAKLLTACVAQGLLGETLFTRIVACK